MLYGNDFATVKASDVVDALDGLPVLHMLDPDEMFSTPVPKLAVRCGITASNGMLAINITPWRPQPDLVRRCCATARCRERSICQQSASIGYTTQSDRQ